MGNSVAGVVLAAGAGVRLRPLTRFRPKALCPVGNRPLVDWAVDRIRSVTDDVTVNVHHGRVLMAGHFARSADNVRLSVEEPVALGTAGALGLLRPWIEGRPVLVTNADAWLPNASSLVSFVEDWDGERARLLTVAPGPGQRGDFGDARYCGVALLPWSLVRQFTAEPSGLYEVCWRSEWDAGRLDLVHHAGPFTDCGTPRDYLDANLDWSGGSSVIAPGVVVPESASVVRSVLWPDAAVADAELLIDAIRINQTHTLLVR